MFRKLLFLPVLAAALPLAGCGLFTSPDKADATVRIPKAQSAAPAFAPAAASAAREWYRVAVTGAGLAPVAVTGEVDGAAVRLTDLEPGAPRYFTAELFSDGGLTKKTHAGVSAGITLVAGETARVTVDVRALVPNRPPTLTAAVIAEGTYYTDSIITCAPDGFSDAEGAAPDYRFSWLVNGADAGVAAESITGDSFAKGDTVRCRVTPFDGVAEGAAVESNEVVIVNSPPTVAVAFNNGPYYVSTALAPSVTPVDADGDAISLTYSWTIGTEPQMITTATFPAGAALRGQSVTVTVVAGDGVASSPAVSAGVVIQNAPPTLASAALSNTAPYTNDVLTVTPGSYTDADGDSVALTYQWYKNGLPIAGQTSASLSGNYFDRANVIYVLVTPNDGLVDGLTVSSDAAVVANSLPTVDSVAINPGTIYENSFLTPATSGLFDADGDALSGPIVWYVNGFFAAAQGSLDGSFFNKGDSVWVEFTAFDGTDYGTKVTSAALVVQNTMPQLLLADFVATPLFTDSTATVYDTYSDIDGDGVSIVVDWYVNDVTVPGENGASISGTYFSKGDMLRASVRVFDGQDYSNALQVSAVIQNTPPVPGSYTLGPAQVKSGMTPFVVQSGVPAYDADGDPLIYMVDAYKNGVYVSSNSALAFTVATLPRESWYADVAVYDGQTWSNPVQTGNAVVVSQSAAQVDVGERMACAITENGNLECWGEGYLGRGSYETQLTPVQIPAFAGNVSSVSVGNGNTCAVKTDNTLWCWGWNSFGEAGQGTTYSPVQSPTQVAGQAALQVSIGRDHVCAVQTNHTLYCWGTGSFGQLGLGTTASQTTPAFVSALLSVAQVSAGYGRTCAVTLSGALYCWGQDPLPAVGGNQTLPALVSLGATVTQVSAGATHACALTSTPALRCWGANESGQLGNGTTTRYPYAVTVAYAEGTPVEVAAGNQFTCLALAGQAECWGASKAGSLGDGMGTTSLLPSLIALPPLSGLPADIDASAEAACLRLGNGAVYCWGFNRGGVLGRGTDLILDTPVLSGMNVEAIDANHGTICTLWAGDTWCWGMNNNGQFGTGGIENVVWEPQMASGGTSAAAAVSVGFDHLCTLRQDQQVWCSGKSFDGQAASPNLGMYQPTAAKVPGLSATAISLGRDHSCAIRTDGTVACWGKNDRGQLGNGAAIPGASVTSPVATAGLTNIVGLSAGQDHNCAVNASGALYCWGSNTYGELGIGSTVDQSSPVQVLASGVLNAEASDGFTCVIKTDNSVWCWGRNYNGSLGDGTTVNSTLPVQVANGFLAKTIESSGGFVCAIDMADDVYCWGDNLSGQLGTNVSTYSAVPVGPVVQNVDMLAAGTYFACAFAATAPPFGDLTCWGHNEVGQLLDPATLVPESVFGYYTSTPQ